MGKKLWFGAAACTAAKWALTLSVAMLMLAMVTVGPVAAAEGVYGKDALFVLVCPDCAAKMGHTAILYYDATNNNYTYMSWAPASGTSTYPWLDKMTLTGPFPDVIKSINDTRASRQDDSWPYTKYKKYELNSDPKIDQVNGLLNFMWYSEWASDDKPKYDLVWRNCGRFTDEALKAAMIKEPTYRMRPKAWFEKLSKYDKAGNL